MTADGTDDQDSKPEGFTDYSFHQCPELKVQQSSVLVVKVSYILN